MQNVFTLDTTVIELKMTIFVNLNRMHPDTQVGLFKMLVLTLIMLTLVAPDPGAKAHHIC